MTHPWPQFDNPRGMILAVRGVTQGRPEFDRLLRLFACAAARTVWLYTPAGACRKAVEVAEDFADGLATAAALESARTAAEKQAVLGVRGKPSAGWAAANATNPDAFVAAQRAMEEVLQLFVTDQTQTDRNARALGHLLDDLFGPFVASPASSPVAPPDEVVLVRAFAADHAMKSAAEAIYRENDFRDMRFFGEKLRAAGCKSPSLIDHCCTGRHARGCWMIDAARS